MTGFDTFFDQQMTDPDFARAYREARVELASRPQEPETGSWQRVPSAFFLEDARVGNENIEP